MVEVDRDCHLDPQPLPYRPQYLERSYGWAIAGLLVCSAIGIGFGLYPAYRAANLDPIEALRYE